jgi:23S rRNA pseudouridine1911/1915/1917 synthase
VHLSSIHHSVTGDEVYGREKKPFGLVGQALHGYRLTFRHPKSGEQMMFYAPLPDYFMLALQKAGEQEAKELVFSRLQSLES